VLYTEGEGVLPSPRVSQQERVQVGVLGWEKQDEDGASPAVAKGRRGSLWV
jgi:hypothetical protein